MCGFCALFGLATDIGFAPSFVDKCTESP